MPSEIRAFVQIASGIHGVDWVDFPVPLKFRVPEDEGPTNEIRMPQEPVFIGVLDPKNHCYGGNVPREADGHSLPDAYIDGITLYDPPNTRDGRWATFGEILHYPWEEVLPHTTAPLFEGDDVGVMAIDCALKSLAVLARVLGAADQTPNNTRLVYWFSDIPD